MFSYVQTSNKTQSCNTDGIPYVFQYDDTVDAGTDTAVANINPFVDGGVEIPAPLRNLSVVADGCDDLIMRVEYLDTGSDCDPCTDPDAVNLDYVYYYIDACEARSFNNGLYVDIEFVTVSKANRTGDPEADWALASATSQDMRLRVYGDRATNNCCSLPEVTNTRGVTIAASLG